MFDIKKLECGGTAIHAYGFIEEGETGGDVLVLIVKEKLEDSIGTSLLSELKPLISEKRISVFYHISDVKEPISLDAAKENLIRSLMGACTIEQEHHYSEVTGYLYSNENFIVGGHDILQELLSHEGKYMHLLIKVH